VRTMQIFKPEMHPWPNRHQKQLLLKTD